MCPFHPVRMDPASCLPRTTICLQSRPVFGVPAPVWAGPKGLAPLPLQQTSILSQCLLLPGSPLSLCSCGPPSMHLRAKVETQLHGSEFVSQDVGGLWS